MYVSDQRIWVEIDGILEWSGDIHVSGAVDTQPIGYIAPSTTPGARLQESTLRVKLAQKDICAALRAEYACTYAGVKIYGSREFPGNIYVAGSVALDIVGGILGGATPGFCVLESWRRVVCLETACPDGRSQAAGSH